MNGGIPATEYSGFYRTAGGRKWTGFIVQTNLGIEPYIFKPPREEIERLTEHGPCFRSRGQDVFFVHLANVPASVDEAILNIEAFLNDLEQKARWPSLATGPVLRVRARAGYK